MIYSAIRVLYMVLNIIELTIFIDCIASWIPQIQDNKFIRVVHNFVYPVLEPFRRLQDKLFPGSPMDFSPIMAMFIVEFLKVIVI